MTAPPSPADLAEIRERHATTFADLLRCGHDGDRWPCDAARLLDHVAALEAALREEWEANHAERCADPRCPHPNGQTCRWPLPDILSAVP